MDYLQQKNLREIEGLNQRGGPTLSFIDLIRAGTMSPELVAYCWTAIARGASFLTAAGPGGAGKSTVLANLLVLLPPHEEIVTVTDPQIVDDTIPSCFLAHEIGSGHWYGYLWGRQVAEFFGLMAGGSRIAGCLHADELDELVGILTTPPLEVPLDHVNLLDLILFIHVERGYRRRVVQLWESTDSGHRLAFAWDPETDTITQRGESILLPRLGATKADYELRLNQVNQILAEGEESFEGVRRGVLRAYAQQ